jgi:HEAT repeat protein
VLTPVGVDHDVKEYPDAGHAFLNDHDPADVPILFVVTGKLFAGGSGYHEPSAALEALRKAAHDVIPTVREAALRGFWAIEDDPGRAVDLDLALDIIAGALRHRHERVRLAAAIALRDRGDRRVLAPLQEALDDRSSWVRIMALLGIARADRKVALAAAISALRDRNRTVRISAAQTLASLRDPHAVEALIDFYRRSTAVESRLAAVDALGHMRIKAVVPTLVAALEDPSTDTTYAGPAAPYPVRYAAAKALRRIRTREALDALRAVSF